MTSFDYLNIENKMESISINDSLSLIYNKEQNEIKICDDDGGENFLNIHDDKIVYLTNKDNLFMSISLDKTFKIWDHRGKIICTINLDNDLLGMEFINKNILLIARDATLVVLNKGETIYSIEVDIESTKAVKILSDNIHFISSNNLEIYDIYTGKNIIKLKNMNKHVIDFKKLQNNKILIKTTKISLWDEYGKFIKTMNLNFKFSNIIESNDGNLLIIENEDIFVFNENGEKVSNLKKSPLTQDIQRLIESIEKLEYSKLTKSHISQFPHIFSPFSVPKKGFEILEEQDSFENKKFDKQIWDFFNRPLFEPIEETLKKEKNQSEKIYKKITEGISKNKDNIDYINYLEQTIKENEKSKKIYKKLAWVTFIVFFLTIVSLSLLVYIDVNTYNISSEHIYQPIKTDTLNNIFFFIGFNILLFIIFFIKTRNYSHSIKKSRIDLAVLIRVKEFVSNIKEYRNSLFKQFPIVKNPALFSGLEIEKKINKILETDIENVAMNECGIEKDDIIHISNRGIILSDWSNIQSDIEKISDKLNRNNLKSYWSINKKIIFATQFIQYIFLTKDKIDVFNTHYNFIENKFIRKEAHAFYYKDVTNITKREIDRETDDVSKPTPATEITLKVSSGDSINLTILNEDSLDNLRLENKDNPNTQDHSNKEKLYELEKQKEFYINDSSMDEEEKEESLAFIDGQIITLKSNVSINNTKIDEENNVDSTIQNIRAQIKIHKQQ